MKLKKCICGKYTIKKTCECGKETLNAHYKFIKIRDVQERNLKTPTTI